MSDDNTRGGAEPSPASAGSQPVAWATVSTEGATAGTLWTFSDSIEAAFRKKVDSYQPCDIMPLYSQPQVCPHVVGRTTQHCSLNFTLTDGERMAVAYFAQFGQWPAGKRHADTLRALLERLG
jgi:hypothetical protein